MSWGARLFVAVIFTILGLSFIATTVALFNEFQDFQWLSFATIYSHLFLFFPTFGIIALIAFYIPAVAFVDLYWHHIPFGKIRFIFGFLVVSAASYYIGDLINRGDIPAIWQLKPEVLKADQGEAVDCKADPELCQRKSVSETIANVRSISQQRTDLSQFSRSCTPDTLKETPAEHLEKRYCFVSNSLLNAESCCLVQKNFSEFLAKSYRQPDNISLMSQVHTIPASVQSLLSADHSRHRYIVDFLAQIHRRILSPLRKACRAQPVDRSPRHALLASDQSCVSAVRRSAICHLCRWYLRSTGANHVGSFSAPGP